MAAELSLIDRASRIAFMRAHMRPYWFGSEAGGICLATGAADDLNARIFNEFLRRAPETAVTDVMGERWTILQTLIVDDLVAFFATARLSPGSYELDNYHLADERYMDLHRSMTFAVQAFWTYAR